MNRLFFPFLILLSSMHLMAQDFEVRELTSQDYQYFDSKYNKFPTSRGLLYWTDEFHVFRSDEDDPFKSRKLLRIFEVGIIKYNSKYNYQEEMWYNLFISIYVERTCQNVFLISPLDNPDNFKWNPESELLTFNYLNEQKEFKEAKLQISTYECDCKIR